MRSFTERLLGQGLAVTLEITPPKKRLDDVLMRRARLLGSDADAVNVIQRQDRLSSLDASLQLRSAGFDPVCHVVNRGRTGAEIESELRSAASAGIQALLCLRGDHAAEDHARTPKIRAVIEMAREIHPGALIGATANQYGPRDRVLANLEPKLRAGARFVQTNPVFEVAHFADFAREVSSLSPGVALLPMVMPLGSAATAQRLRERLGLGVPGELVRRLENGNELESWAIFREIVEGLARDPSVAGLAIMTPEMDAPPASAERIGDALARVRR